MADQLALEAPSKAAPTRETASTIYDAIVAAHQPPEWACFAEVSDATGGRASRRADALALNLWPSRGLEIRGFEIKVSRSDLKRELDDASKAEAVGQFCHTWCLATPAGLVRAEDNVPPNWGLFEVTNHVGRFKRLPTYRPADEIKAPTRLFMAAVARAANAELHTVRTGGEWVRRESIQNKIDEAFQRGVAKVPDERNKELNDLKVLVKLAAEFLQPLGIDLHDPKLNHWNVDQAAKALKIGHAVCQRYGYQSLPQKAIDNVEAALGALKEAAKALKKLEDPK